MTSSRRPILVISEKSLRGSISKIINEARNAPNNFLLAGGDSGLSGEFLASRMNKGEVIKILNLIYFNDLGNSNERADQDSVEYGGLTYRDVMGYLRGGFLTGDVLSSVIEVFFTQLVGPFVQKDGQRVPTADVFSDIDNLILDETGKMASISTLYEYLATILSGRDYSTYAPRVADPKNQQLTSYYSDEPRSVPSVSGRPTYDTPPGAQISTSELNDALMRGVDIRSGIVADFKDMESKSIRPIMLNAKMIAQQMEGNFAVPDYLDDTNLETISQILTKTYNQPAFVKATGMASPVASCYALVNSANAFFSETEGEFLSSQGFAIGGTLLGLYIQSAFKAPNLANIEYFASGLDDQIAKAKATVDVAKKKYEIYAGNPAYERLQKLKKDIVDAESKLKTLSDELGVEVSTMRATVPGAAAAADEAEAAALTAAQIASGKGTLESAKRYEQAVSAARDMRKSIVDSLDKKLADYDAALTAYNRLSKKMMDLPDGTKAVVPVEKVGNSFAIATPPQPPRGLTDAEIDAEVIRRLRQRDPDLAAAFSSGPTPVSYGLEDQTAAAERTLRRYQELERDIATTAATRGSVETTLYPGRLPPGAPGPAPGPPADELGIMRDKIAAIDENVKSVKDAADKADAALKFLRQKGYADSPWFKRLFSELYYRSGLRQRVGLLGNSLIVFGLVEAVIIGVGAYAQQLEALDPDAKLVHKFLEQAFTALSTGDTFIPQGKNHLQDLADDWGFENYERARSSLEDYKQRPYTLLALSIASFAGAAVSGRGVTPAVYSELNSNMLKAVAAAPPGQAPAQK